MTYFRLLGNEIIFSKVIHDISSTAEQELRDGAW